MAIPTFLEFFLPNFSGYTLVGGLFFLLGLLAIVLPFVVPPIIILAPILGRIGGILMLIGLFLAFVLSWIVNLFISIELTLIVFGALFLIVLAWNLFKKKSKKRK